MPAAEQAGATTSLSVFIRQIVVHDDADPGPGKGELDLTFGVLPGPTDAATRGASVRCQKSVASGKSCDVRECVGPVEVRADGGWLFIAAAGIERDPVAWDQVRGGLTMLGPERRWGLGAWYRTTNGRHFEIIFCVIPGGASEAACPVWTGELLDAPHPGQPTEGEYAGVLPQGFDRPISETVPAAAAS